MPGGAEAERSSLANLIADAAEAHEAHVLQRNGGDLLVAVRLRRSDGKFTGYTLAIDAQAPAIKVREQTPERLPAFCPDRHINGDGSFCMNWHEADPLYITDAATAERWWATLLQFLRLQERAAKLGRWPTLREWAHGRAAEHQRRAEICAGALGTEVNLALASGYLRVTRRPGQSGFVRLEDGRRAFYSVWVAARRVATLRQRCVCGSGIPINSCADHADRAAELVFALEAWTTAEDEFWRHAAGRTCCGTLATCPLKVHPAPANGDAQLAVSAVKAA